MRFKPILATPNAWYIAATTATQHEKAIVLITCALTSLSQRTRPDSGVCACRLGPEKTLNSVTDEASARRWMRHLGKAPEGRLSHVSNKTMIEIKYKKGNRLAWTGFLGALTFGILHTFQKTAAYSFGTTPTEVLAALFVLLHWLFVAIIIWGCSLALQAKNRSLWWLFLLAPMLAGVAGMIMVVGIFALGDKSSEPV